MTVRTMLLTLLSMRTTKPPSVITRYEKLFYNPLLFILVLLVCYAPLITLSSFFHPSLIPLSSLSSYS